MRVKSSLSIRTEAVEATAPRLDKPQSSVFFAVETITAEMPCAHAPATPHRRLSLVLERRSRLKRTVVSMDMGLVHLLILLAFIGSSYSLGVTGRFGSGLRRAIAPQARAASSSYSLMAGLGSAALPALAPQTRTAIGQQPVGVGGAAGGLPPLAEAATLLSTLRCAKEGPLEGRRSLWSPAAIARPPAPSAGVRWAAESARTRRALLAGILGAAHGMQHRLSSRPRAEGSSEGQPDVAIVGVAALAACSCATKALSEASCALLFPAKFSAVRSWHSQRRGSLESELLRAERRLVAQLPSVLAAHPNASEAGARHATVQGRVKTAQSLFEKGVLRGKAVNDLLALRVIIEPSAAGQAEEAACAAQCRSVQNLVDTLWPGSIVAVKDYIAHPKGNGYQSLHLLVDIGAGHRLELQVRTRCMHEHAERGAAAHTRYKADAVLAYT